MIAAQKLDTRVVHRYIHKEQLTQEQYDKYLSELPDVADQGEFVDYETKFVEEAKAERESGTSND